MFQRLFDSTKWICCFLVMSSGPAWSPVNSVTVRTPPNTPSTIEAQAKFFQYRHLPTSEDYDQGHRLGSERHFVERHERSRPATGLFSAKVRWGDKKGGYGEHYWDLNHAGHAGNDGYDGESDDGSYHEDPQDIYNESKEQLQNYESDEYNPGEYNPDDTSHYEESGRAKRAHNKVKSIPQDDDVANNDQVQLSKQKIQRKNKEHYKVNEDNVYEEVTSRPIKIKPRRRVREQRDEEAPQNKEKNHIVLVVNQKQKDEQVDLPKQLEPKRFVPHEDGTRAGHPVHPQVAAPVTIPRLFLEQSTGHIVDRTTGQAYVLQPIPRNVHYS